MNVMKYNKIKIINHEQLPKLSKNHDFNEFKKVLQFLSLVRSNSFNSSYIFDPRLPTTYLDGCHSGHVLDGGTGRRRSSGLVTSTAAPTCRSPSDELTRPVVVVDDVRVEMLLRVPVIDARSARPTVT